MAPAKIHGLYWQLLEGSLSATSGETLRLPGGAFGLLAAGSLCSPGSQQRDFGYFSGGRATLTNHRIVAELTVRNAMHTKRLSGRVIVFGNFETSKHIFLTG